MTAAPCAKPQSNRIGLDAQADFQGQAGAITGFHPARIFALRPAAAGALSPLPSCWFIVNPPRPYLRRWRVESAASIGRPYRCSAGRCRHEPPSLHAGFLSAPAGALQRVQRTSTEATAAGDRGRVLKRSPGYWMGWRSARASQVLGGQRRASYCCYIERVPLTTGPLQGPWHQGHPLPESGTQPGTGLPSYQPGGCGIPVRRGRLAGQARQVVLSAASSSSSACATSRSQGAIARQPDIMLTD